MRWTTSQSLPSRLRTASQFDPSIPGGRGDDGQVDVAVGVCLAAGYGAEHDDRLDVAGPADGPGLGHAELGQLLQRLLHGPEAVPVSEQGA